MSQHKTENTSAPKKERSGLLPFMLTVAASAIAALVGVFVGAYFQKAENTNDWFTSVYLDGGIVETMAFIDHVAVEFKRNRNRPGCHDNVLCAVRDTLQVPSTAFARMQVLMGVDLYACATRYFLDGDNPWNWKVAKGLSENLERTLKTLVEVRLGARSDVFVLAKRNSEFQALVREAVKIHNSAANNKCGV